MNKKLFKNGLIILSNTKKPLKYDILIEKGLIIGIDKNIVADDVRVIDCENKIILPSLFDMHVHLREPGFESKETVKTGTEASLNGGITGLVAMPNTNPAIDSVESIVKLKSIIDRDAVIPVSICAAITKNRESNKLSSIDKFQEQDIVMISDDGDAVSNSLLLRNAMELAQKYDILVSCHCEDKILNNLGVVNEGIASRKFNLNSIPAVSEEIIVERDLRLAQLSKVKVHIQHISTAETLKIINRYKDKGVDVTCEITPHHLIFSDEDILYNDANYKMNPPLRSSFDKEFLLQALKNGLIDCIATDHAPHTKEEKKRGLKNAPFGITGLETALVSLYHFFIKKNIVSWNVIVDAFSINPRKRLGLKDNSLKIGNPASFIIFNPNETTYFSDTFFKSKSINTPFINKKLSGKIEKVIF